MTMIWNEMIYLCKKAHLEDTKYTEEYSFLDQVSVNILLQLLTGQHVFLLNECILKAQQLGWENI